MLARPRIGQPDRRPGARRVRWTVSRSTTVSSWNASGSRYRPFAELRLERRIRVVPLGRRAGRAGRLEELVERRSWTPADVRAAGPRLARREQRVEVGVEPDRDVGDRGRELPGRQAVGDELGRPAARRGWRRGRAPASRRRRPRPRRTRRGSRPRSGLRTSIGQRLLGARRVPAVVLLGPAGLLEGLGRVRRWSRSTGGSAAGSNSGELGGIGPGAGAAAEA